MKVRSGIKGSVMCWSERNNTGRRRAGHPDLNPGFSLGIKYPKYVASSAKVIVTGNVTASIIASHLSIGRNIIVNGVSGSLHSQPVRR